MLNKYLLASTSFKTARSTSLISFTADLKYKDLT